MARETPSSRPSRSSGSARARIGQAQARCRDTVPGVTDYLSPGLLIASPQMRDPFFERTVVLLWTHDEARGAMGVVINRFLEHLLPDVLDLGEEVDLTDYGETRVAWGGPVEENTGTVLTPRGLPETHDGWAFPGIGVSRSPADLVELLQARAPITLCLGYAGWGPGQLDHEIEQGGWLFTDCDPDIVFSTPPEARYDRALASLGLTPTTVWMQPIHE